MKEKMAGASLVLIRWLSFVALAAADELNRTAEPGQDVILPCEAPGNEDPEAAEWKKQDDDEWLIYLRPNQSGSLSFGSSYEDRVDLQDRQLKNGNASLVLRNVTTNDSKTYECRVGRNRSMELISTIHLVVASSPVPPPPPATPGKQDENGGEKKDENIYALLVLLVPVGVVICYIYIKHCRRQRSAEPPAGPPLELQELEQPFRKPLLPEAVVCSQ
ncbi:CD226 antigen-like [Poecilia reticulata]|uniref:CD226 antigen-like n=1 Tax=Poecilia reticulata TaxID=8081 RepID=UPI0004A2CE32|nr:PREDICTED: CD226 antigen-like [Poecilia reticulata]